MAPHEIQKILPRKEHYQNEKAAVEGEKFFISIPCALGVETVL